MKQCTTARCLFVQPPGRDARATEANVTNNEQYIAEVSAALRVYTTGVKSTAGSYAFIGDSWGSIACFCTLHELRDRDGFVPAHVFISGDASPVLASEHN